MMKQICVMIFLLTLTVLFFATGFTTENLTIEDQNRDWMAIDSDGIVNLLYFYSTECQHCQAVNDTVLIPLQEQYSDQLNIVFFEISIPDSYEILIRLEQLHQVAAEQRGIPTAVIGDVILIGEDEITDKLPGLIENGLKDGGIGFPDIDGINFTGSSAENIGANFLNSDEFCEVDEPSCEISSPIYIAYFYQTGCKVCSRVKSDLNYLKSKYPQIIIDEFNVYDHLDMGNWLAQQADRESDFHTPAVYIGDTIMIGEGEISPQSLENAILKYASTGAEPIWEQFDPNQMEPSTAIENFSWITIAIAGLIDGLNPCAFATLIFFVSYLSLSKRKGKEILLVGGAFTLGVFVAYLIVGLGFYKILDLLGNWLKVLSNWVYGLTAVFCLVLAVLTFRDALRVKSGKTEDMQLHLPEQLRDKINARIRKGRSTRAYISFAFGTGLIISLLELACTGQIYLPTIIFMTSQETLQIQALFYLVLYNLMFIVPLLIVFVLAYYGTTSRDLSEFLRKRAMQIKFGMAILFLLLGSWLLYSIFK